MTSAAGHTLLRVQIDWNAPTIISNRNGLPFMHNDRN